jgi:hypothetical protein
MICFLKYYWLVTKMADSGFVSKENQTLQHEAIQWNKKRLITKNGTILTVYVRYGIPPWSTGRSERRGGWQAATRYFLEEGLLFLYFLLG